MDNLMFYFILLMILCAVLIVGGIRLMFHRIDEWAERVLARRKAAVRGMLED